MKNQKFNNSSNAAFLGAKLHLKLPESGIRNQCSNILFLVICVNVYLDDQGLINF